MNKAFKNLGIGDEIYFIEVGKSLHVELDQYGNTYKDGKISGSIKIHSIASEDDRIYINPTYEYGKVKGAMLSMSFEDYEKSKKEVKIDRYPNEYRVYFSNISDCNDLQKEYALKEIENLENEIVKYKERLTEKIKSIRERYYKVLNPKSCGNV